MDIWIQAITTVGFPIVSFLLCGGALKYVYDRERKSLDDTVSKIADLTAAVNHNSETINDLVVDLREACKDEVHRRFNENDNCKSSLS